MPNITASSILDMTNLWHGWLLGLEVTRNGVILNNQLDWCQFWGKRNMLHCRQITKAEKQHMLHITGGWMQITVLETVIWRRSCQDAQFARTSKDCAEKKMKPYLNTKRDRWQIKECCLFQSFFISIAHMLIAGLDISMAWWFYGCDLVSVVQAYCVRDTT